MTNEEQDRCRKILVKARKDLGDTIQAVMTMKPGQGRDVRRAVVSMEEALLELEEAHRRIVGEP